MFGILYYIFLGLFKVFYEIYVSIVNTINRIGGLRGDGKSLGYMDYHGAYRDRVTNKVMYPDNKTGTFVDYKGNVLYDPKIAKIKKYREENRKESIEKGRSTYIWLNIVDDKYDTKHPNVEGTRYKDIESGRIFVTRQVEEDSYYVDIDTGELVRYTDSWQRFRNEHPLITHKKLFPTSEEEYNERIKSYAGKYLDMYSGCELY